MQWPSWFVGILIGVMLAVVAHLLMAQAPDVVASLVADVDLVKKAVGFVGVAIGLGSFTFKAASSGQGLAGMNVNSAAGPGTLAVASALLLI